MNNRKQTDGILLDFSMASEDYHILIHSERSWRQVNGLTQEVITDGDKSKMGNVKSGVLQESVPGSSLFIIFIRFAGHHASRRLPFWPFHPGTKFYQIITTRKEPEYLSEDLRTSHKRDPKRLSEFKFPKYFVIDYINKNTLSKLITLCKDPR